MGNEEIFLVVKIKTTGKSTCNEKDSFSLMKESFCVLQRIKWKGECKGLLCRMNNEISSMY